MHHIIPYLHLLGITDIYASPLTRANSGSSHGYDVTNPNQINPEIGDEKIFKKIIKTLAKYKMSLILDFVPNHMAATRENPWWQDVLIQKKQSDFANYFDINWQTEEKFSFRRFFDINELVCLKVENPSVFNAVHQLLLHLVQSRMINGIRIDHIDGLYDPSAYLQRLQKNIIQLIGEPLFIVVEKVLGKEEALSSDWPIMGTSGYEFLNVVNAVFINNNGYKNLSRFYQHFTKKKLNWSEVRYQQKKKVIQSLFFHETQQLSKSLLKLAKKDDTGNTHREEDLFQAIVEITAHLPIYRTYINYQKIVAPQDRAFLSQALYLSRINKKKPFIKTLQFLQRILLLKFPDNITKSQQKSWLHWVMQWQQYTGPVMAKGFEDTTCYVYNPLVSLNEVGSDPSWETGLEDLHIFHQFLRKRQRLWPGSLNTISTHDTKRSEDVRARLNVLSEISLEWAVCLNRWHEIVKSNLSTNTEIFLYQNLLGVWPLDPDYSLTELTQRFKEYMLKASREAKTDTSWQKPDEKYEQGLVDFIHQLLNPADNSFLQEFLPLQKKVAFHGALNSLSQVLLKITAPGIPDTYQGNEFWNFSLVDPDNRRPVEFAQHIHSLEELLHAEKEDLSALLKNLCDSWTDGRIKLYLTYQALQFRQKFSTLFLRGQYLPLQSSGKQQHCVISFARRIGKEWIIIIVPRFTTHLVPENQFPFGKTIWNNTRVLLPARAPIHWKNIFTQETFSLSATSTKALPLANIFLQFPVALLQGYVHE